MSSAFFLSLKGVREYRAQFFCATVQRQIDMSNARKSITVKEDTHQTLWNLKEDPDHTYDEILRELLRDARDIEVRADEL